MDEPEGPTGTAPRSGDAATVTWIQDGDTFVVTTNDEDIEVRLMGINTPDQGECLYDEATDHLIDTLKGEVVTLDVFGIDQFGRTLAHVFMGTRHLNLELVEGGMAIATTPDGDDPHGADLLSAEEEAWLAKVGLWADDACGPSSPLPDVAIASVDFDPRGPDDDVLEEETVTIRNQGTKSVNLTGWMLRDESSRHRHGFASGTKLEPGEEMVVTSADRGWTPGNSPVWNNDGDMALLLDKHGRIVARARY